MSKIAEGTDEGIQPDFFGGQKRVVIEGKGQVRQASLEDYGKLEKMKAMKNKPIIRFEIGKNLTKDQKSEVLKSIGDVYKDHHVTKDEFKGIDNRGEEIYGYPYRPELFVKSDITGKMLRHYIVLPNNKISHPTELYPNIKQSEVDRAIIEAKQEEEKAKLKQQYNIKNEEIATKNIVLMQADTNEDASINYSKLFSHDTPKLGFYYNPETNKRLIVPNISGYKTIISKMGYHPVWQIKNFQREDIQSISEIKDNYKKEAKPKAKSANARISEIESLLASKERISTKEHGANRDVLRMELGDLRGKSFAAKHQDIDTLEREILDAENEIRKRSSGYTRSMQAKSKKQSGSKLTTLAYQDAYPNMDTMSLEFYREELADQIDILKGKRVTSSNMFEKAIRVMNDRTARAQQSDLNRTAKIAPDFEKWVKAPNRFDWPNVDTKIKKTHPPKQPKRVHKKLPARIINTRG